MASSRIDLYWLPLGAGGWFVRFNGRVYETIRAHRERRARFDLYHTALVVTLPGERWIVENSWPIPDDNLELRGVTIQGPVGARSLQRFRVFRYEVRRWRDGEIADIAYAVASPHCVSDDYSHARRVLRQTESVPPHVWGRDESHLGDMWNSNSVISWLLTRAGVPMDAIRPPVGGRAPGWSTGIALAERMKARGVANSVDI